MISFSLCFKEFMTQIINAKFNIIRRVSGDIGFNQIKEPTPEITKPSQKYILIIKRLQKNSIPKFVLGSILSREKSNRISVCVYKYNKFYTYIFYIIINYVLNLIHWIIQLVVGQFKKCLCLYWKCRRNQEMTVSEVGI